MHPTLIRAYAQKLAEERGRPTTPEEAQAEIHQVVIRVARNLAQGSRFGYHTAADMEHEGIVEALEVLARGVYDPARPLENFLHVHLHNRLQNLKRKHFFRSEPPCSCCDTFGSPAAPCPRWVAWQRRNAAKLNLMRPLDVTAVADERERNMATRPCSHDEAATSEALGRLDRELAPDVRADYLRMRAGVSIPKVRRQRVREAILGLLGPELMGD